MMEQGNQVGPPPTHMRTVGLGVWSRERGRSYRAFFEFFTFDASSAPLGRVEIDETVELSRDGSRLTSVAVGRVFNAAGDQIASNCVAGAGDRVAFVD